MLIQKLKIILKSNIILIFLIIVVFINEIYSLNNTNKNISNDSNNSVVNNSSDVKLDDNNSSNVISQNTTPSTSFKHFIANQSVPVFVVSTFNTISLFENPFISVKPFSETRCTSNNIKQSCVI